MNVPSYVQSLLETASYEFDWYKNNPGYAAGYTLAIRKRSDYQTAGTFRKEIERLQKWVNRQEGGEMLILGLPKVTHHCTQYAYVTIFDPVMLHLEKFIKNK